MAAQGVACGGQTLSSASADAESEAPDAALDATQDGQPDVSTGDEPFPASDAGTGGEADAAGDADATLDAPDDVGPDGADASSDAVTCAAGQTSCHDAGCVDLRNDPGNCGSCGSSCNAGYCEQSACHEPAALAGNCGNAWDIAVDSTNVYWTCSAANVVMTVPKDGGTPATFASTPVGPAEIALDSANAYWTSYSGSGSAGPVMSAPLAGGTATTLAAGQSGAGYGIAVDGTNVYWTAFIDGTVMSVPIQGGTPTTLASGRSRPTGLAIDTTSAYWVEGGGNINGADGNLMKVPLQGGSPVTLASGLNHPLQIAVDGATVYWTDDGLTVGPPGVFSLPVAGGTPTTLSSSVGGSLALDATNVYCGDVNGLHVLPRSGGTGLTLATGTMPWNIAVDSTSIYWTGFNGGVLKIDKP